MIPLVPHLASPPEIRWKSGCRTAADEMRKTRSAIASVIFVIAASGAVLHRAWLPRCGLPRCALGDERLESGKAAVVATLAGSLTQRNHFLVGPSIS